MKRLALFAPAFVSTFMAHAGPIAPRGGPEVTAAVEAAPLLDGTLVERLEATASPAPLIPDAPIKGNPLWSIPLSALSETRDRPLFNVTRRPPPETVVAAPMLDPPTDNKPSELEGPPFTLIGTILSSEARVAVLLDQATSRVTQLRQGKTDAGWTAQSVGARSIVLRKGDSLKTLNLPGLNIPPAAAVRSGDNR
jgi:general secretion pathway protein N